MPAMLCRVLITEVIRDVQILLSLICFAAKELEILVPDNSYISCKHGVAGFHWIRRTSHQVVRTTAGCQKTS